MKLKNYYYYYSKIGYIVKSDYLWSHNNNCIESGILIYAERTNLKLGLKYSCLSEIYELIDKREVDKYLNK